MIFIGIVTDITLTNMKRTIRLKETQLRTMIRESVNKALKEAYSIPKNIDINDDKRAGLIPYIIKMANLYRDFQRKIDSLYDSAYAYYDTSDNFHNDSLNKEEQQFKQYFWQKFDSMFESVYDKLNEATNELFELEEEIEESINKHGSENYAEYDEKYGGNPKNAFSDYIKGKGY